MTGKNDSDKDKDTKLPGHDLWDLYTRDIKPLDPERSRKIIMPKKAGKPVVESDPPRKQDQAISAYAANHIEPPQIDKRTARKLKRGQIAFEAQLDLHGLYREQAKTRLSSFIEQSYHAGMRCVLVITGKGKLILDGEKADDNTPGVIRRHFKSWIKEAPLNSYILSVEKAQIRHGGAGAFYVLLRRKR